jgi:hypothetical protein
VSLATHGYMTAQWQNSAARRHAHQRHRAHIVRLLGWEPEGAWPDDCYPSSTGELRAHLKSTRTLLPIRYYHPPPSQG